MKTLRIFHDKSNIIWTHGLEGEGKFPQLVEDELKEYPSDTECIELIDNIKAFVMSDENTIVGGKLVIGKPREIIEPEPPRDLLAEIDQIKLDLKIIKTNLVII